MPSSLTAFHLPLSPSVLFLVCLVAFASFYLSVESEGLSSVQCCGSFQGTMGIEIISAVHNSSGPGSCSCITPPLWFSGSSLSFKAVSSFLSQRTAAYFRRRQHARRYASRNTYEMLLLVKHSLFFWNMWIYPHVSQCGESDQKEEEEEEEDSTHAVV